MRWCGLSKKKASIIGSSLSFLTVSTVELLDAKSLKWGASVSDLSANLVGSALYLIQQSIWDDQKIQFKYSFHQNFYSKYRANLLGENLAQNLIKDYNGQTYWLSLNAKTIFTQEWMPQWLNISVGYSAKGMLGAHINPEGLPYFKRARQYFLSLDIDLRQIPVRSKALKKVFRLLNVIKFPMPAIELRSGQIKAHYLYF